MNRTNFSKLFALSVFLLTSSAFAQATRTWVSGVGDDANPCSRTAPCKTFAGAISKTAAAGEINCLDPAGFGAVTITKSMTIDCRHTLGGVLVSGTNAIIVNGASIVVSLKGLDFMGLGTGLSAVNILNAKSVLIEDSTIRQFATAGVNVNAGANNPNVYIRNTTISSTTDGSAGSTPGQGSGVWVQSQSKVVLDKVTLLEGYAGVTCAADAKVTINNSVISGSTTAAISSGSTCNVSVDHTVMSGNDTGASVSSTVRVSDSMFSHNTNALTSVDGGVIDSFGNNRLNAGNNNTGTFTGTISQQ